MEALVKHNGGLGASSDPMMPVLWHVKRRVKNTSDTFTMELTGVGREMRFAPGQFNMLYAFGVGEVPISISGDKAKPMKLVHTIRSVGTVTQALGRLRAGAVVGVRGPFGTSWPTDEARGKDVVIVAGGIGLAPLRPAIYEILANRANYGKVIVLYGARTPEDILFADELISWGGGTGIETHVTVDRALRNWYGHVGVVTSLFRQITFDSSNTVAMVCGPEIMMRFTITELQNRGTPTGRIYVSMERNMKCALGFCGHCQYGPDFICKDGPVFRFDKIEPYFRKREI